ncbi:MAG: FISUMP domain-containing protein [Lentimicrobium sp.]
MKRVFKPGRNSLLNVFLGLSILISTQMPAIASEEDFVLTIQNIVQTATNVLEFDVYLLDTDPTQAFELSYIQMGINFNPDILNGAEIAMVSRVPGLSELPPDMEPIYINAVTSGLIRVEGRDYPGAGNGYIVSAVSPGTRITRLRITNPLAFTGGSTPDMSFTSSSATDPSYATKVAIYLGGITNTFLTVVPGVNAIVPENPAFTQPIISNSANGNLEVFYFEQNTPPAQYTVTAMNLTDNLTINTFSTTTLPTECQLEVSLSPNEGFTDLINLSPVNGSIDTIIYIKPACNVVPMWCHGKLTQTSNGAFPDTISVRIENTYYLQCAPIVSLGHVEAVAGSSVHVPLSVTNFNNISIARYYIDFDPTVITFDSIDNIKLNGGIPYFFACYNCSTPINCCFDITLYILCNVFSIDPSNSRLFIEIHSENQFWVNEGDNLFNIVFNYSGGVSQLQFTDGEYFYHSNCGGFDHPEIINVPHEDYYFNGSVGPMLPKTISLTLYLEGLYNTATGGMNQASGRDFPATFADEISIGFAQNTFPYTIVYEIDSVLVDRSGVCQFEIPGNMSGEKYIVVKHRNSIETWSANPVSIEGTEITYDFTNATDKAFGDNLKLIGSKFCLFGGDVNQDDFVDTGDMSPVDNDGAIYASGYISTDVNGDGIVDTGDMTMIDNNTSGYIGAYYPEILMPSLTTDSITEITGNTAQGGGDITHDGNVQVTSRGVCWSTSQNPTLSDNHTDNGAGSGTFVSNITALHPATTYHVRAYATNINGTVYGNEVSFTTTPDPFICGTTTVTDVDGNFYNTVLIGDQCWMKENLNTGVRINGTFNQTLNGITEKYCYQDNPSNCEIYGGLYKWTEMMQSGYGDPGIQGICPDGWHIPTDGEWATLISLLGGEEVAGGSLKEEGTIHWDPPNTGANNASGFTGLPGGQRWPNGDYFSLGKHGVWWSSNYALGYEFGSAYERMLLYEGVEVNGDRIHHDIGCSVRCLRNIAGQATVNTLGISNIYAYTATCSSIVTNDGGAVVTARGVCWSTFPNPTIAGSHTSDGTGIGSFTSIITGLIPLTQYYVRAYAVNNVGIAYGEELEFSTFTTLPTINTRPINWITGSSAITGGDIINPGIAAVTSRGVCWSTSPYPTLADSHTIDGSGTGTFNSYLTGLDFSTTYYIRAYATNMEGTAYGDQMSFTTLDVIICNGFTLTHSEGSIAPVAKTVTYNVIITGLSGQTKCWITQNLGADRQALSATDDTEESAGWYWQFNRQQGYKHDGTTRTPNTTWISSINENSDWQSANDPCNLLLGSGWRIPTKIEWSNAENTGDWNNCNDAFASMLRLHNAGILANDNGSLYYRGYSGDFWSSSQYNATFSWLTTIHSSGSYIGNGYSKPSGLSLRCLRD